MDFLLLPDEMLANVLKYSDFITTTEIRKLNSQVNNVAKAYEIGTRLPVDQMVLNCSDELDIDDKMHWECNMDVDSSILNYIKYQKNPDVNMYSISLHYKINEENNWVNLDNIMSKTELRGTFNMADFFDLDDDLLECFHSNRKSFKFVKKSEFGILSLLRILTTLAMSSTQISCSPIDFREFIKYTKKLLTIDFHHLRGNMDVFFQSGIFEIRVWNVIQLFSWDYHGFSPMNLNDKFLSKVVKNCKHFHFYSFDNSYTIDGIIKLLKACAFENATKQYIKLGQIKCETALVDTALQRLIESMEGRHLLKINSSFRNVGKLYEISFSYDSTITFVAFHGTDRLLQD